MHYHQLCTFVQLYTCVRLRNTFSEIVTIQLLYLQTDTVSESSRVCVLTRRTRIDISACKMSCSYVFPILFHSSFKNTAFSNLTDFIVISFEVEWLMQNIFSLLQIHKFFYYYAMSVLVAILASLAFESPIVALEKIVFRSEANPKSDRTPAQE